MHGPLGTIFGADMVAGGRRVLGSDLSLAPSPAASTVLTTGLSE